MDDFLEPVAGERGDPSCLVTQLVAENLVKVYGFLCYLSHQYSFAFEMQK